MALSIDHEVEVDGHTFRAHVNGAEQATGIGITIEHSNDDGYIVEEPVTGVFGVGESIETAFEDFAIALVEYHNVLSGETRITEQMAEHLRYLEGILGS